MPLLFRSSTGQDGRPRIIGEVPDPKGVGNDDDRSNMGRIVDQANCVRRGRPLVDFGVEREKRKARPKSGQRSWRYFVGLASYVNGR